VGACPTGVTATTVPATLEAGKSWAYRLASGADQTSADVMAVKAPARTAAIGSADFTLAAGKLIRTGTGDIRIASGGNINLADNRAAIYTAGTSSGPVAGFTNPAGAQYSQDGGDVSLRALGDVSSVTRSEQLYSNWLYRQGRLDATQTGYTTQPSWWVRFEKFEQGVATLGGGNVTIQAGGKVENLSASAATQARTETLDGAAAGPNTSTIKKTGGGSVRVETGTDLLGGQYYADNGELVVKAAGNVAEGGLVSGRKLYTILALGDAHARVQARGDMNIHAVINPHMVVQSSGGANANLGNTPDNSPMLSMFNSYGDNSTVTLSSAVGNVNFHNLPDGGASRSSTGSSESLVALNTNAGAYRRSLNFGFGGIDYSASAALGLLPSSVKLTSFQGDVLLNGGSRSVMRPSPAGNLEVLAAGSVRLPGSNGITMSDSAPFPDVRNPAESTSRFPANAHALVPVHAGDNQPVRIYAVAGDVQGDVNRKTLILPKSFSVKAGRDVRDVGITAQNIAPTDVSSIEAGRDVVYSLLTSGRRTQNAYIEISGPGRLEVIAGRDINLGASAGLVSHGNVDNLALPAQGASIHVAAGVGAGGIDYSGALDRLLTTLDGPNADDTNLWHARWLTGNNALSQSEAAQAVRAIRASSAENQRTRVRSMLFTALQQTGVDRNDPSSPYAGDYARGYAAIELLFPSQNADGSARTYQGDINLFASRILTEAGGDIEFMAPGGKVIVGLQNTPADLLDKQTASTATGQKDAGVLGMAVVSAPGSVKGFARDDILVNQSRILAVGGGDVMLWSSEGDIDAGKGKKTASVVPPPVDLIDADGNVKRVLQGAATGSGIGALPTPGAAPGDVYLVAPRGTVNAGDAGIRATNVNIAAALVVGTDNIAASGSSVGVPVADTSAVTATASGATSAGNEAAKALADMNKATNDKAEDEEEKKKSFKPTFVRVEVVGYGE
jgi:filamentous hemagglutinin